MEPSNSCVDPLKPSSSRKQRLGLINRSRQRDRRRPAAVKGGRGLRLCAGIPKRHTRIDSLCCLLLLRCLCVEWSCPEGASYKLSSVEFHVGRRGEECGVARARFSSCHRAHRVARPRLLSMQPLVAGRKRLPGLKKQLSDATDRENGETCTRARCCCTDSELSSFARCNTSRRSSLQTTLFLDQIELGLRRQQGAADKHFDQGRKVDRSEEVEGKPVAPSSRSAFF